jgi:flagellar hook assembly protein FlgD
MNKNIASGIHSVVWNGKNNVGEHLAAGMYFYKLIVGDFSQTKKMILLK